MAKGLTKLKSALKKWQSFSKPGSSRHHHHNGRSISASNHEDNYELIQESNNNLHPVYVGKSRRRYLISSDIIDHPLFKELVDRSSGSESVTVDCEVVLFEHLLWMLENADPQPESLEELVDFYAC